MDSFNVVNILDAKESIGEAELKKRLSDFSCKKNKDVESFLKNLSIEFTEQKKSVTHLVLNGNSDIVAFFCINT